MVTPKVVKLYFSFVMAVVMISTLSSFPIANDYMKTALAFFNVDFEDSHSETFDFSKYTRASVSHLNTESSNPFDVHFDFKSSAGENYARAGQKNKELMKIVLKSADASITLSGLKLKIANIDPDKISSAVLVSDDKLLSRGSINGDYFDFKGIDYDIPQGQEGSVSLVVDLNENVRPHDVVRFDLEKEQDLEMMAGGIPYHVKGYYPLKGEPLFIVK